MKEVFAPALALLPKEVDKKRNLPQELVDVFLYAAAASSGLYSSSFILSEEFRVDSWLPNKFCS